MKQNREDASNLIYHVKDNLDLYVKQTVLEYVDRVLETQYDNSSLKC